MEIFNTTKNAPVLEKILKIMSSALGNLAAFFTLKNFTLKKGCFAEEFG
jgi:hypothetical protein